MKREVVIGIVTAISISIIYGVWEYIVKVPLVFQIPKGAVIAFDSDSCPAYGRFIRGIDKSGSGTDPDGQRSPNSLQNDELGSHSHSINTAGIWKRSFKGEDSTPRTAHEASGQTGVSTGRETRPKNVALLFCIKV